MSKLSTCFARICLNSFPFKRDRKLWIFGSRLGDRYDDNSKWLFEFIVKSKPEIKAIWITNKNEVMEKVRSNGAMSELMYSRRGTILSMKAGIAIVSISPYDVNSVAAKGAKFVQLWHGTPIKRTDAFASGEHYDLFTVSAKEYLNNGMLGDITKTEFVLTGYPRNDALFLSKETNSFTFSKTGVKYDKLLLYAPTYRDSLQKKTFKGYCDYDFNPKTLNSLMEKHNALFVFKLHPSEKDIMCWSSPMEQNRFKNLYFADPNDSFDDMAEWMRHSDVLITDYSSATFDYLLTGRPIIFAPFDLENYNASRGFSLNYGEITPGPKARNWNDILRFIAMIFNGKDDWQNARLNMQRRFNAYSDGKNCERVFDKIYNRFCNAETD